MLEVTLRKRRRELAVELDFRLGAGEALGLFGPSGAGKSTVLACIAGLDTPDAGAMRWNGTELFPAVLPLHRRPVGYLTQDPQLFPHLDVARNVSFGAPDGGAAAWVAELRAGLQLQDCWHAPATAISAGQARRVALARMLARRPPLVLLDEPFTGLDRPLTRRLLELIGGWQRQLGFTLIAVDHQPEALARLCPRALVMMEGRVAAQGTWEELARSPRAEVRELLTPL